MILNIRFAFNEYLKIVEEIDKFDCNNFRLIGRNVREL